MPAQTEAPRSATEAAQLLAREGKHVHLVSEGEPTCLKGSCFPTAVQTPSAAAEHTRLTRLSLAIHLNRL
jgi:hypothetical protein